MERIILGRLNKFLDEAPNARSPNQYGFRKGRSTIDAMDRVLVTARWTHQEPTQHRDLCALVLIDVKNAFNSLSWRVTDDAMSHKNIPHHLRRLIRSYLSERKLQVGPDFLQLSGGVPQGSVLGPTLWNLAYNQLLDSSTRAGTQLIGFADDIDLVATARDPSSLQDLINFQLGYIADWMSEKGLIITPKKSEAILLTRRKTIPIINIVLGGHPIPLVSEAKYLGVTFDNRLTFRPHIKRVTTGTKSLVSALFRM